MNIDDIYETLCSLSIFQKTPKDTLKEAISEYDTEVVDFAVGEIICSPEKFKNSVGVIITGTAVAGPIQNDSTLLRFLGSGDIFGIANLYLDGVSAPSKIVSRSCTSVLFIDSQAFIKALESDSTAMSSYVRLLNEKIIYLNNKISTLTAGTAEKKLALYIYENCENDTLILEGAISSLAGILNIGRASLYRAFDVIEEKNIIVRSGKKITIIDKNGLLNCF